MSSFSKILNSYSHEKFGHVFGLNTVPLLAIKPLSQSLQAISECPNLTNCPLKLQPENTQAELTSMKQSVLELGMQCISNQNALLKTQLVVIRYRNAIRRITSQNRR
jgi:hypothetical protein